MKTTSVCGVLSFATLTVLVGANACSNSDAPVASTMVCEPGRQTACACVGGVQGAQSCTSDGSGWAACACPDAGTTGGSAEQQEQQDQRGLPVAGQQAADKLEATRVWKPDQGLTRVWTAPGIRRQPRNNTASFRSLRRLSCLRDQVERIAMVLGEKRPWSAR